MARPDSRIKAGYLPIEEHHYPTILSLLKPGSPDHLNRMAWTQVITSGLANRLIGLTENRGTIER